MGKYIKCKGCNTINDASAYECSNCHLDLTKRQNKIMNLDEDALLHDYQPEEIEECKCEICGAINPRAMDACLACGSSLSDASIILTKQTTTDVNPNSVIEAQPRDEVITKSVVTQVVPEKQIEKKSKRLVDIRTHDYYEMEEGDRILGRECEWGYHLSRYGYASRRHLMLRVSESGTQLYVIETANGTYIRKNGTLQVLSPNTIIDLKSGDVIGLGGDETNDINVGIVRYEEC